MKHNHLWYIYTIGALAIGGATLPAACAQTATQPRVQAQTLVQKTSSARRDEEPDELSWQYFETAELPFANFKNWWAQLPQARRDSVMAAAKKANMLQSASAKKTSLFIQAEAFRGEGWNVATVDGRTVLEHGGGHTGAAAQLLVDVPHAGTYRLWSHWWNLPENHNSFQVRIRPIETAGFKYGWQQTVHGDYLNHRFAWQWFNRKDVPPVAYDADKKGFQWESSPMVTLPQGKVLITMAPLISSGPFTSRRVDSFLLTQDPLLVPDDANTPDSNADDAKSLSVAQIQPASGSPEQRRLWNIRPGAVALHEAPAEVAGVWREWRDAFIERLAEGKDLSNAEQAAAEKTYFDARWNLVGTPAMVKQRAAYLQSANTVVPGFIDWIEAEDFKIDKGWEVADEADTGGNKILRASYGDGLAHAAYTTSVPHAGKYRLWVRFAQIVTHYNHFDVSVTQNGETVKKMEFHDTPPEGTGSGYRYQWRPIDVELNAGECRIELTKNRSKSPYAYRMVDAFVLTDNAQYQPDGVIEPVPATVSKDRETLFNAAQKGEVVAWIATSWTSPLTSRWVKQVASDWMPKDSDMWTGFRMTDWPKKTDQIATSGVVQVSVQPGAMENRVLHLTNPSDKPITITPAISGGGEMLSWRVVADQYQPRYDWQPMPLLRRHQVTIPPHLTASLWLNFDARSLPPGLQKATLKLDHQEVNFAINVTGIDIRTAKSPLVGGWASPWPMPDGWRTFADIGLTTVHGVAIPKDQMREYDIKLFVLMLGEPKSKEQVTQVVQTLKGMGLGYEDWVWEISDEPGPNSAPQWIAAAKEIKATDPEIRIWVNPGERKDGTPQAIADMSPYVDVYCPYINHWDEKDAGYQKLLQTLGDTKLLYTTPCFEEKSPQAPLEILSLAAASLQHSRDGWDAFALRSYYPYAASAWDEVNAPFGDQAVSMYPGAWDQVIGSRNLEALRVAVQRWKTSQAGG